MKNKELKTLVLVVMFVVTTITVTAQTCLPLTAGCLDPSFGNGGMATVPSTNNVSPISTVTQSDSKIVAMPRGLVSSSGHKIVRWNVDGTLDTTFGTGGIASFVWKLTKGPNVYYGNSNAIAIQNVGADERILVVGQAPMLAGNKVLTSRLRIDRLMLDGSYDMSWGINGTLQMDVSSAIGVAVQSDDQKIVLVSASFGDLIRLNANGTLDTSFGSGGIVSAGNGWDLTIDPAGRILVANFVTVGKQNNAQTYISIKRFLNDGTLDSSFGTNGIATTGFAIGARYVNVRVDPVGNVIVASNTAGSNTDFAVERFLSNGMPDTSFSTDGIATVDFAGGLDMGQGGAIQFDGKIVMVGRAAPVASSSQSYLAIVRFNFDGSLDSSFGNNGKMTAAVETTGQSLTTALVRTDPACACEKIIATGGSSNYLIAARFLTF